MNTPKNLTEALYILNMALKGNADAYAPEFLVAAAELIEAEEPAELGTVDALYDKCPWLTNYDSAGNWVGSVANESGWTA